MPNAIPAFPALVPRAVLFGAAQIESPRLSPNGTMLLCLAPHEGKQSVWVRSVGGGDDRLVAYDAARPIPWARWQGDGQHVLYLQDHAGDENYHLFQVDLHCGTTRDVTPARPADNATNGRVRALPLLMDARFPNEVLVAANARDPRVMDVHRVDLATGAAALDTVNPGDVLLWLADHASAVRAAIALLDDGSCEIRVRDSDTPAAPWRALDTIPLADGVPRLVAFSPDGAGLYVITAKDANAHRLVRYTLTTGASCPMYEDAQHDVERAYVDPATREIVAVGVLKERLVWTALAPAFAEDLEAVRRAYEGDFTFEDASADGESVIVRYQSDVAPGWYHLYRRSTRATVPLFCSRPALLGYELAPMRPVAFRARDGLELHGYLTLPPGVEARLLPTVLYVHGGPWVRDRWEYEPTVQWLANRGCAVLQVNFRGSAGYGKAFLNAGDRQWAGAMRTDLLDARAWAIECGYAEPARVAILGGSYGGYAVLTALSRTPEAFACGVDIVGPSNLETLIESLPAYKKPMRGLLNERIGEDPQFLKESSPLYAAGSIRAPLLIVHGANDPRVKQRESDQVVDVMRQRGIPVDYLVFENEGHGLMDPDNLKRFAALTERFLSRTLGTRVEPATAEEHWGAFVR
jgi:dipeptidyl aminopeptidase/acylaminoacyl peptidase